MFNVMLRLYFGDCLGGARWDVEAERDENQLGARAFLQST